MDLKGNRILMVIHLEFGCTKNIDEYEGLLQGLCKVVDKNVKHLEVYGDSKIVVKHVRNTIHYNSCHLQ